DDTDTDTDTDVEPTVAFSGQVIYDDGTVATGNVRVQMCDENLCRVAMPDASGNFTYEALPLKSYAFDVVPLATDNPFETYATPLDIYTLDSDAEPVTLDAPVYVYTFTNRGELTDDTFDAGDGLIIDVDDADIERTFEEPDADYVASVIVDPTQAGLPLQDITGDIVGMWFLGPFKAKVGWTFRLEDTGLAEGTTLRAYNSYYDGIEWVDLGQLTVDADGDATGTAEIQHLSTIVVVQE
ncbi:MAG: hypothetical protein AAFV53_24355, partial [Myxococcota bacterium]